MALIELTIERPALTRVEERTTTDTGPAETPVEIQEEAEGADEGSPPLARMLVVAALVLAVAALYRRRRASETREPIDIERPEAEPQAPAE